MIKRQQKLNTQNKLLFIINVARKARIQMVTFAFYHHTSLTLTFSMLKMCWRSFTFYTILLRPAGEGDIKKREHAVTISSCSFVGILLGKVNMMRLANISPLYIILPSFPCTVSWKMWFSLLRLPVCFIWFTLTYRQCAEFLLCQHLLLFVT